MSLSSTIKVIISGDSEGAKRALKQAQKEADNTGHSIGTMAKVAAGGFVALTAAAVDFGKHAVQAAMDEDTSHTRLLVALKNAHQGWKDNEAAIKAADKAGEHFGYTAADTESALAQGEIATGNLNKALSELSIAQDIAAATGKPLADAMLAVEKAGEGQLRPLKQLGIDLPIAAGGALKAQKAYIALGKAQGAVVLVEQKIHDGRLKGKAAADALTLAETNLNNAQQNYNNTALTGQVILDALKKKVGGEAAAAALTFQGRVQALKAEWTDFTAKIGNKIIPVITNLMKLLSDPQTFTQAQAGWYVIERGIIGVVRAAEEFYNVLVHIDNIGTHIGNFFSHIGIAGHNLGTSSHTASTIDVTPWPTAPDLSGLAAGGATGGANLSPYAQLLLAWQKAHPGVPMPGTNVHSANGGYGPPVHHITIIHLPAGAAPAAVRHATTRNDKQNGRTNNRQFRQY